MTDYLTGVTEPRKPLTLGQIMRQRERIEERAEARTRALIEKLLDAATPIWHQGDGMGGVVIRMIDEAARERGMAAPKSAVRR